MLNWFKKMFTRKNNPVRTNQAGVDLIKKFEGFSSHTYKCPAGILTIGYGFTDNVKEGDCITKEQAEKRLRLELIKYEKCVTENVYRDLTENQFSALVSLSYNIGCKAFTGSTLCRLLNQQADVEVCAKQFLRWNIGGGKVLLGLTKRRQAEMELFLTK
jgi:lysozyme